MAYRLLIDVILAAHFGFLVYLLLGGFLAWRWPRTIALHVPAAVWGLAVVAFSLDCPLTWAEGWARRRAGQTGPTRGFIDRYLTNVVYPERYVDLVRVLVALVVLASWIGWYVLWRRRSRRRSALASGPRG